MSPDDRDFQRFSRQLDDEWLRERLRRAMPDLVGAVEEEELARALMEADPLAPSHRSGWLVRMREALTFWPGRLAVAGATAALLLIGFVLGRVPMGRPAVQLAVSPPPKPAYQLEQGRGLAIGPAVKPGSERRFREAMAFYDDPDFQAKALPLLRDAVAEDPSNDQAQFWLGIALLLDRKSAEAIPPLEAGTRLAPGSKLYAQYLLLAYLQTGAVEQAIALQSQLLKKE